MEHTVNILEPNKSLITSLLKVFNMFQLRIFYDKHNEEDNFVEDIAIKCINCNKDTGFHLKHTTNEEMINKFVLNAIFHHVGMTWIIFSNNKILYEIE